MPRRVRHTRNSPASCIRLTVRSLTNPHARAASVNVSSVDGADIPGTHARWRARRLAGQPADTARHVTPSNRRASPLPATGHAGVPSPGVGTLGPWPSSTCAARVAPTSGNSTTWPRARLTTGAELCVHRVRRCRRIGPVTGRSSAAQVARVRGGSRERRTFRVRWCARRVEPLPTENMRSGRASSSAHSPRRSATASRRLSTCVTSGTPSRTCLRSAPPNSSCSGRLRARRRAVSSLRRSTRSSMDRYWRWPHTSSCGRWWQSGARRRIPSPTFPTRRLR